MGHGGYPALALRFHPLNFSQLTYFPCQLREAVDHDPFLLLSADLKRELAGEQLYRRALRESGLWRAAAGSRAVGRQGLRAQDRRVWGAAPQGWLGWPGRISVAKGPSDRARGDEMDDVHQGGTS